MPPFELLLAFAAATAVFTLTPGPAMLYAAARTMADGRRAGLMASLGIHMGGYLHVFAAAAGLSIVFHAVPVLYMAVKLGGAGYLVWLGIAMFRGKPEVAGGAVDVLPKSARRAFVESVAVEVLNPKAAMFYLAFLPQFVDVSAAYPVWLQLLLLGIVVNMAFSLADLAAVALAGTLTSRLRRSSRARRITQRIGGSVLIGLGAHLALRKS
jgi:threonine/homoserine/homoserine lactone efflux protein